MIINFFKVFIIFISVFKHDSLSCSNEEFLYWCENYRLTWSDFRGNPSDFKTSLGLGAVAVTATKIEVESYVEDGELRFHITNKFMKRKSWVKDSTNQDEHTLNHERLHFDIAEVFARKIRKELAIQKGLSNEAYQMLIQSLLEEKKKYNKSYDSETSHGLLKEQQIRWSEKIKLELEELKEYSFPCPTCSKS
ncbi:hypothetical protein QQ008_16960 [Fulvivirgaceae bacterium BMA10]|uniref:DUF922 domain-containing protein n=1 Tax=Splendidivirga corallicola TaxID=3051826 RepID=A0ABT8KQP5_9BACT|nr:hypothetical protein [Fulvivirgaceae bacterium BMA10]